MSSEANLGSQIKEDHLTCSICLSGFRKPKALPCLHTFCELCLDDYVVSRGYESAGTFPCPLCRVEVAMPAQGIKLFPDNHLVASLTDTVDQLHLPRPVPKPRRSLGQYVVGSDNRPPPSGSTHLAHDQSKSKFPKDCNTTECRSTPGPDDFELVDRTDTTDFNGKNQFGAAPPPYLAESPPPYSQVADTHPDKAHAYGKVCTNDTDPGWMVIPGQIDTNNTPGMSSRNSQPGNVSASTNLSMELQNPNHSLNNQSNFSQAPIGWNVNALGSSNQGSRFPDNEHQIDRSSQQRIPSPVMYSNCNNSVQHSTSSPLYPSMPADQRQFTACAENLILRFGKQGSTARDFIKPIGLAISKEGHYIVSDNGGDQNRFLVFNSGGEITTAFKCGCKVKDIAITENNEMVAAIHKTNSAIRRFTLGGQLKGEYGKFFTYEEPSGIAELTNKGIVLTGASGRCIYVLSDQMKEQTRFGRKGNGDGYFSHPGFVTVDSNNHIIVSDKVNCCIQVFNVEGKFKLRIGSDGSNHNQLNAPMGLCTDSANNIIIADSGNFRVEVFTSRGRYLSTVVRDTWQLGEDVKPVNVSMTPTGKVAVLLRGPYFGEVRVYSSRHQEIPQDLPNVSLPGSLGISLPSLPKNFGWNT